MSKIQNAETQAMETKFTEGLTSGAIVSTAENGHITSTASAEFLATLMPEDLTIEQFNRAREVESNIITAAGGGYGHHMVENIGEANTATLTVPLGGQSNVEIAFTKSRETRVPATNETRTSYGNVIASVNTHHNDKGQFAQMRRSVRDAATKKWATVVAD